MRLQQPCGQVRTRNGCVCHRFRHMGASFRFVENLCPKPLLWAVGKVGLRLTFEFFYMEHRNSKIVL
jgi:hypothetical protein